jgi:hypothetical protein
VRVDGQRLVALARDTPGAVRATRSAAATSTAQGDDDATRPRSLAHAKRL